MEYLKIRDALITASSERNANHAAKRVKTYDYFDHACAWAAAADDRAPWVQFDMEQTVTVWGVLVRPRCDEPYTDQRVTTLQVAMSERGMKWNDVSGVISTNYSVEQESISWFDEAFTARYWKIQLLSWVIQPSMKADLIGQPKGNH